jgi:glucose-fructose oxidoreductase
VYLALPNDLHHEYAVRAARAGIHVLCEKPMAVTEHQCEQMIAAAREAKVRLMIAYRLHFERANLQAIATASGGELGDLRFFNSTFSMQVRPGDIRTRPLAAGGGTLYDLGIYCINAARYLFKAEPDEVFAFSAKSADPRFAAIDEMTSAVLRFPGDRLASFTASFGASATAAYDLVGTAGSLRVEQAYEYQERIAQTVTIGGKAKTTTYEVHDHFAAEIDYFSTCVLEGRDPEPSGAEGLADVRVIRALYDSAHRGAPVRLALEPPPLVRPGPDQAITYPPPRERPEPVHAAPASLPP